MTQTTYEVQVIQLDRGAEMAELREALDAELQRVGMHRAVEVSVGEEPPSLPGPSVAVYLGSSAAAEDPGVASSIDAALAADLVVIPVVSDLGDFASLAPAALSPVNGWEWSGPEPAIRLARILLEELGIEDSQRRVFISHHRADGLGAAEQLHDGLTHTGFLPFIDRFAIRVGEDVQARIADALEDHAFLLLLETPSAADSEWILDEVDYALSHTMGTLILRWPGNPRPIPGTPGLPRIQLPANDLTRDAHDFDVLTDAALDRVLAEIEAAHAYGLVRRRRMMIASVDDAATAAGCSTVPMRHWRLLVECSGLNSTLVGITPRLPTAADLQRLDQAAAELGIEPSAVLIHSARVLRERLRDHLVWVTCGRELAVMPENAIGGRWTRA
jgi:hypothetical protein